MFIRIYAVAVCFSAMLCIAISVGVAFFDLVQYTLPEYTTADHRHNETFHLQSGIVNGRYGVAAADSLDDEALLKRAAQRHQAAIRSERHNAISSLLQVLSILVVSIPLFYFHWRLARRLESEGFGTAGDPGHVR